MQENNFEKQVQQKLDELRLTPSEPVWQNIEEAIRKKKERRLVLWFIPFLLMTGGVVWWQAATWQTNHVPQQTATQKQPQQTFSKPHIDQQVKTTDKNVQAPAIKQQGKNRTATAAQPPAQKQVGKEAIASAKSITTQSHIQKQVQDQTTEVKKSKSREAIISSRVNKAKDAVAAEVKVPNNPVAAKTYASTQNNTAVINKDQLTKQDSLPQPNDLKMDSAAKPVVQPTKQAEPKKRLQWSVVSRVGVSNTVEALIKGFGAKALQDTYPTYNSGGSTTGGYADSGYKQPAAPTKGMQFSIGAVLRKHAGEKSFFTAGLQYSFYSYHLAVGAELPLDSITQSQNNVSLYGIAVRKVFRNNGSHNQFTNTLHFLELPLGFEYQLLKKHPLHVQHGVAISYLLRSKVLQYDYASNKYYQRSDALRKTGINLFTAVEYTVWKGKTLSLQAGPHLQYGLQSIFKDASGSHLLSGGLAISMAF